MKRFGRVSLFIFALIFIMGAFVACGTFWQATSIPMPEPTQINQRVVAISAGSDSSFVIMEDGSLWGFGGRDWLHSQELDDWLEKGRSPVYLMDDIVFVSAGGSGIGTMVITSDGSLWDLGEEPIVAAEENRLEPVHIMDQVRYVSVGMGYAMFITSDNHLWGWGRNERGQLGDGTSIRRDAPVQVMEDVLAVSAGFTGTMAVTSDGALWAWGSNHRRHLGEDREENRYHPLKIKDDVIAISVSRGDLLRVGVITSDHVLWAWARNDSFEQVMEDVVAVSVGRDYTMAVTFDGALWAWGENDRGQLGNGTRRNRSIPVHIMDDVLCVSAGFWHSMATTVDGSLWVWGDHSSGQLGIDTIRGEQEMMASSGHLISAWFSPIKMWEYAPD